SLVHAKCRRWACGAPASCRDERPPASPRADARRSWSGSRLLHPLGRNAPRNAGFGRRLGRQFVEVHGGQFAASPAMMAVAGGLQPATRPHTYRMERMKMARPRCSLRRWLGGVASTLLLATLAGGGGVAFAQAPLARLSLDDALR